MFVNMCVHIWVNDVTGTFFCPNNKKDITFKICNVLQLDLFY